VFLGVFGLLALIGWLSSRLARRFPAPAGSALPAAGPAAAAAGGAGARPGGMLGALAKLAPYLTVVVAAFVPLAAGLYLATSAAWALAERAVLRRRL
jgi:YidC/Oxa1 family membrane protein insertase